MSAQGKEKTQRWLLPEPKGTNFSPGLYLVSTPIGNLGDITLRALDTLAACEGVICEDSRVTGRLLDHFGLRQSLIVYNDHSAPKVRPGIIQKLKNGALLALVSDAGTPLLSDPGYRLVQACHEAGIAVIPVPGANAVLPALQVSGLPMDRFVFIGFLPAKAGERRAVLSAWKNASASLVAYETAPRLLKGLADIQAVLGPRRVAVVREITKKFEEARMQPVAALIAHYSQEGPPRGEIVLVIEGAGPQEGVDLETLDAALKASLRSNSLRAAADVVAAQFNLSRKTVYARALSLKQEDQE
ncbi:MAG: 16S rRNA (cytidine(1402)-2'-O)-methyltransferase [Alphaproteobacteria bacterium]|nr:16S rRNA (cytidine(1402)-2'-O)-methyltransferase [Alphaproteobacteria bacterium]